MSEEIAQHEVTLPITVNMVSSDEAKAAQADQDVAEEVLILRAARAQEEARRKADAGEFEAAQSLLRDASQQLRSMAPHSKRADELLEQAHGLDHIAPQMSVITYSRGRVKGDALRRAPDATQAAATPSH